MDKSKIEAAMAEELESHGLTAEDLTEEELNELRKEVECTLNGGGVLDGVLYSYEISSRKMEKELKELIKKCKSHEE